MFYLLILPISCFFLFQVYQLREMKKHDEHLFRFCELRRDSIDLLSNEYETSSRNDYVALRKLIEALNNTIHNYKSHKTVIFNFRLFARYLREFKSLEEKADEISTNNQDLLNLICRMQVSVFEAFLAYTPFFKSEIIVSITIRVLSAAVDSGISSVRKYRNSLVEVVEKIEHLKHTSTC